MYEKAPARSEAAITALAGAAYACMHACTMVQVEFANSTCTYTGTAFLNIQVYSWHCITMAMANSLTWGLPHVSIHACMECGSTAEENY